MACPYFVPLKKRLDRYAFRFPLGAFWVGECGAAPGERLTEELQLNECNFGYARGRCRLFPAEAEVDAVRFTARGEERLFILERDHIPVRFGLLPTIEPETILEKQAQAWIGT